MGGWSGRFVVRVALGVAVAGCGAGGVLGDDEPDPPGTVIVSDPAPGVAAGGVANRASSAATGLVYISLPSGTVPDGDRASIENLRTSDVVTTTLLDGGFDPIGFPAVAGDSLRISIRRTGGGAPVELFYVVPIRRRPVVVRTDPPPWRPDVPLNAIHLVVFSEPIDERTATPVTVQIRRGAQVIPGTVRFRDSTRLFAEVQAGVTLQPATEYRLVISQGVRDQDGDALEAEVGISFTTSALAGRIAYYECCAAGGSAPGGIYVVDADGYGETPVARSGPPQNRWGNTLSPAWSPDGTRIAFFDGNTLSIVNEDGSGGRSVTTVNYPSRPTWAPDGRRLAFQDVGIAVINDDGSGFIRLTDDGNDLDPAWSPTGSKIAFARHVPCDSVGGCQYEIYLMNPDGSQPTRLTKNLDNDNRPAWSPDGTKIAFERSLGGQKDIFVMNADGSGVAKLTNNPANDVSPAWSPDGTKIVYSTRYFGRPELYVINADGTGERQVTRTGRGKDGPSWTAKPARP